MDCFITDFVVFNKIFIPFYFNKNFKNIIVSSLKYFLALFWDLKITRLLKKETSRGSMIISLERILRNR